LETGGYGDTLGILDANYASRWYQLNGLMK